MKTPEAGVSTHSSPKSNKGAILRRGFDRQANLAPQEPREIAATPSWAEVSEPFAYVNWNFAAYSCRRPRPTAPSQNSGIATRLPITSHNLSNIWDLRPPVSVEVSIRELKRTQQQPIPTYAGADFPAAAAQAS